MFRKFFRRIFCFHEWSDIPWEVEDALDGPLNMGVGSKDWRINASCWGCVKCGKKKLMAYDFIPIRFIG